MTVSHGRSRRRLAVALCLYVSVCGCQSRDDESRGAMAVDVVRGETTREVSLVRLAPTALGVTVADVVLEAWPELDLATAAADFISVDGFRPASRSPCQGLVPVAGSLLDQGFLDPQTADLSWEESLEYPGCLHPHQVATVLVMDIETQGATVGLTAGDGQVDVDLTLLPTAEVNGVAMVRLDTLATASGVVDAPHLYDYDFEGSGGSRPAASGGLAPLAWSFLASGWIDPVTRDLTWDASLGLEPAWSVEDVAVVHLIERENEPASVRVVHEAEEREVDLGALEVVRSGSDNLVLLQTVIAAAALVDDPSTASYDFEGSDGYRVVEGHDDRVPVGWDAMGLGWIHPVSRNIEWDDSLDLGSPWFVRDVAVVYVLEDAP
jgi:hypothetical protein